MNRAPTARELAAQTNGGSSYACPRCGCQDWRPTSPVEYTYGPKGAVLIKRHRNVRCRHCGKEMVIETKEVATAIIEIHEDEAEVEPSLSIFPTNRKTA